MRNAEAQIQAEIVRRAREAAPHAIVFAIPNDGLFTKAEAAKRKWIGVLAGVPDLCIVDQSGRANFLEVKQPGGKPTEIQTTVIGRLAAINARCAVVTSVEEAERVLADWGLVPANVAPHNEKTA